MNSSTLAQYIGISEPEVAHLLMLSPSELFNDKSYQILVLNLNSCILEETLPEVRASYEAGLPELKRWLQETHSIDVTLITPRTLSDWVVSTLRSRGNWLVFSNAYNRMSGTFIVAGLDSIVEMLSHIYQGSKEWQRAMCLLSLPLLVDNRQNRM